MGYSWISNTQLRAHLWLENYAKFRFQSCDSIVYLSANFHWTDDNFPLQKVGESLGADQGFFFGGGVP